MKVVKKGVEPYDVYIGRGSKWGNPYEIPKDGTRKEVIQKYKAYLLKNKKLMDSIMELDGKILCCFCAPKACHGDVIIEIINMIKRGTFI